MKDYENSMSSENYTSASNRSMNAMGRIGRHFAFITCNCKATTKEIKCRISFFIQYIILHLDDINDRKVFVDTYNRSPINILKAKPFF